VSLRALRLAALVEAASLAALVLNLATVHIESLASMLGPIHGCAYLIAIVVTWSISKSSRLRAFSIIPGIGGLIVLRQRDAGPPRYTS
jgi:hypothetical protein